MIHPISEDELYIICNAYWDPLVFTLPNREERDWHLLVNTAEQSPRDIYTIEQSPKYLHDTILVTGRSMIVMVAKSLG